MGATVVVIRRPFMRAVHIMMRSRHTGTKTLCTAGLWGASRLLLPQHATDHAHHPSEQRCGRLPVRQHRGAGRLQHHLRLQLAPGCEPLAPVVTVGHRPGRFWVSHGVSHSSGWITILSERPSRAVLKGTSSLQHASGVFSLDSSRRSIVASATPFCCTRLPRARPSARTGSGRRAGFQGIFVAK